MTRQTIPTPTQFNYLLKKKSMKTLIHTPYNKRTIGSLMQELEELGGSSTIKLNHTLTAAILPQNTNNVQACFPAGQKPFLSIRANKNKYKFDFMLGNFSEQGVFSELLERLFAGFNVSVLLSHIQLQQLLGLLRQDGEEILVNQTKYSLNPKQNPVDLLAGTHKTKSQAATATTNTQDIFYRVSSLDFLTHTLHNTSTTEAANNQNNALVVTRFLYPEKSSGELRIFRLPRSLSTNQQCRSQLVQILEYLRTHGGADKCYKESISKLFIKKEKITSTFIDLYFDNCFNYVFLEATKVQPGILQHQLDLLTKFRGIDKVVKKVQNRDRPFQTVQYEAPVQMRSSPHMQVNQNQKTYETNNDIISYDEFEYCRSLERKTHSYSIPAPSVNEQGDISFQYQNNQLTAKMQPQKILKYKPAAQIAAFPSNQQISLLNSEHVIEVSKYHETIQNLNAKILVLSQEKGYNQLCAIYQKEIIHLELTIQALKKQIAQGLENKGTQQIKSIIRKMQEDTQRLDKERKAIKSVRNEEIRKLHEVRIKELEQKLKQSETSRQTLVQKLSQTTRRLELRERQLLDMVDRLKSQSKDSQLQQLMTIRPSLNVKSSKQYDQLIFLVQRLSEGNGMVHLSIINKVNELFENLSKSKGLLVQSNNFLVELQSLMEKKLGHVDSGVIMDCNRFIRGYLLKTVDIAQ